ncbi:hypothetical protein ACWCV9_16360 [Streptomyces sp. NPDC001606]
MLVRKFHRHSSQKGAPPSRGVRHCGHSSGSGSGTADTGGRPPPGAAAPPAGGGKPYPPAGGGGGGGGGTAPAMR